MFFNVRLAVRVAALSAIALWISAVAIYSQPVPNPSQDLFLASLANRPLQITETELNPRSEGVVLSTIEALPAHGGLERDLSSPEPTWVYTPDPGFFGRDGFTYRIGDEVFRAWLLVQPVAAPIAGRWPTASCAVLKGAPQLACPASVQPGHGMELGWWNALEQTFNLCDWQGPDLRECVALAAPVGVEAQTWSPLVLDVDGDGWHELALRSWSTGEMQVFKLLINKQGNAPAALEPMEQWLAGARGELLLAGDWSINPGSELGVYQFADDLLGTTGRFLLETGDEGVWLREHTTPTAAPWPLAGDWLAQGKDQVAVFDRHSRMLWITPVQGGVVHSELIPERGSATSVPLVTPVATGRTEAVIMLFDATQGRGVFHLPQVRPDEDDPLPLEVVVDPTGGPIFPPL